MKAPSLYKLENLQKFDTLKEIDGKWVPARPLGFYSIWSRIKLAWMVFTGKADAFIWPGDQ